MTAGRSATDGSPSCGMHAANKMGSEPTWMKYNYYRCCCGCCYSPYHYHFDNCDDYGINQYHYNFYYLAMPLLLYYFSNAAAFAAAISIEV
jgi:hypothetical protein